MILSGQEIKKHMGKEIIIEPFDEKRINPNSYNLSLAGELLVYDNHVLDMKEPNPVSRIIIPEDGLLLEPNRLYLGRTNEYTSTSRYVPMLEGRSSPASGPVHPCYGRIRGHRIFRLLDSGNFLCTAGQNLSQC